MRKYVYWLFPVFWVGIIFLFSAQPYEEQNIKPFLEKIDFSFFYPFLNLFSFTYNHSDVNIDSLGPEGFAEFFIRKGAHVIAFFLLCCLIFAALHKTCNSPFLFNLFISFFITVAYAGIDEFHQGFTDNRTAYIGDVFIDSLGAFLAIILLLTIHYRKANKI